MAEKKNKRIPVSMYYDTETLAFIDATAAKYQCARGVAVSILLKTLQDQQMTMQVLSSAVEVANREDCQE